MHCRAHRRRAARPGRRSCGRHGVGEVAIERPDGPVVDTLLDAGLDRGGDQPEPGQEPARPLRVGRQQGRPVRRLRAGRHPAHRPGPAAPAGPRQPTATVALRRACRARKDLVNHRVAVANQLRAHLRNVFPGAVGLFADLDSAISLALPDPLRHPGPRRLAHPQAAGRLAGQAGLLAAAPTPRCCTQRLLAAPRGATGDARHQPGPHHRRARRAAAAPWSSRSRRSPTRSTHQLDAHADAHIFTSLPRSGRVRAARLLAEIGDCRARFPTPESLTCLAGAAPSTRQSGKAPHRRLPLGLRQTTPRRRHRLRRRLPTTPTPGPPTSTTAPAARGHDHPHAVRILARAWLHVIWHCWQDGVAYNPDHHRALQRVLTARPRRLDIGLLTGSPGRARSAATGCSRCWSRSRR